MIVTRRWMNILGNIALIGILLFSIAANSQAKDAQIEFHNPHFSPDGRLLAFDLCSNDNCDSVIHDIAANTFTKFVDRKGRKIANLSFSPSGSNLLFVAIRKATWPSKRLDQQLATGQRSGTKFNVVTSGDSVKMYPSFADENHVIYWGVSNVPAKQGGGTYEDTRLVEFDIRNKIGLNLLSSEFRFYRPSPPISLGDGDRIITSMYGFRPPGVAYEDWLKRKKNDELYIVSKSKKTVAALITGIQSSGSPTVIRQSGEILFIGLLDSEKSSSGYAHDVFRYDESGSTRITMLRTYMAGGIDITSEGGVLAIVVASPDGKELKGALAIYDLGKHERRDVHPGNVVEVLVDIVD